MLFCLIQPFVIYIYIYYIYIYIIYIYYIYIYITVITVIVKYFKNERKNTKIPVAMLDISLLMEELTIKWIQNIPTYAQLSQHNF